MDVVSVDQLMFYIFNVEGIFMMSHSREMLSVKENKDFVFKSVN
jgi:hypothetical protein